MLDDRPRSLWRRLMPVVLCILLGTGLGIWHNAAVARGANDPVTNALRTALSPAVRATNATARWLGNAVAGFRRAGSLARENERLRDENRRLKEEISSLREAGARVARLERYVAFAREEPHARLVVPVIALQPGAQYGTIVVGAGKNAGIHAGSVVVTPDGLVGHIFEVSSTTAAVLLCWDPRAAVGARVQRPESRAVGICRGLGERMLQCGYLSREADVRVGDTMVTSGLGGTGGIYPGGIVIGTVTAVSDDPARSTRTATVRMAVDSGTLEEVVVLR